MTLHHRCGFCGWQRGKGTATVLDPLCERCGCVLDALVPPEAAPAAAPAEPRSLVVARRIGAIVLLLGIAPMLAVAAKLGYGEGGLPLAAGATAIAVLLVYVFLAPDPA